MYYPEIISNHYIIMLHESMKHFARAVFTHFAPWVNNICTPLPPKKKLIRSLIV